MRVCPVPFAVLRFDALSQWVSDTTEVMAAIKGATDQEEFRELCAKFEVRPSGAAAFAPVGCLSQARWCPVPSSVPLQSDRPVRLLVPRQRSPRSTLGGLGPHLLRPWQ